MTDPTPYELAHGQRCVRFAGWRLGYATSHAPAKLRWAEIGIYRSDSGRYIVAGVGRTVVEDEVDRHWVVVCADAHAVVACQRKTDAKGFVYIPNTNLRALEEAARQDPAVAEALAAQLV